MTKTCPLCGKPNIVWTFYGKAGNVCEVYTLTPHECDYKLLGAHAPKETSEKR